ncbi:hypothetical protein BD410DRAFT_550882 [Rickenella mellea]|uniref:SET domain-containing protein n=1 Tax=Rickenella mellea TaxID=50990 RepID=A0A4Y7PSA5_9AGAM|nr:hypothetical protein BD410DRAFT_550882 [Rickenella mellea]
MELRAIRPINAGDEISVSYVAQWKARSKRQDELKATYNFTCCCPACEPPSPKKSCTTKSKSTKLMSEKRAVIAASDGRRMLISSSMAISDGLWEQWAAPTSSLPSTKIVEFHEGVLLLRAEEGYRKGSEINIAYLAHAYAALGDREGFTHWSTKLMEWRPWGPGPTGLARRATWERWVEDPTLSPAWGLRGTGNSQ